MNKNLLFCAIISLSVSAHSLEQYPDLNLFFRDRHPGLVPVDGVVEVFEEEVQPMDVDDELDEVEHDPVEQREEDNGNDVETEDENDNDNTEGDHVVDFQIPLR